VGSISTLSIAQTEANNTPVTFDWDGTGYQKQTGWVGANDGMLVLDRNFNNSVDNGTELLSNPLVADPAKGLRSLAALMITVVENVHNIKNKGTPEMIVICAADVKQNCLSTRAAVNDAAWGVAA
jgi:hypothetical protein